MTQFKFPTTLAANITFFNAESLSPDKLNNIFQYIKSGIAAIEMFVGNGIDYSTTNDQEKKVIGSLSSAIGVAAGNIYVPYNFFSSLYEVYKRYCSTFGFHGDAASLTLEHASYNFTDHSIEIKETVNIPISHYFKNGGYIGLHFSTSSDLASATINITNSNGDISTIGLISTSQPYSTDAIAKSNINSIVTYRSYQVSAGNFVSHISLSVPDNTVTFKVFSIYYTENINSKLHVNTLWKSSDSSSFKIPYNSFFAIGLDHKNLSGSDKSYCTLRHPCKWSSSSFNSAGHICDKVASNNLTSNCSGNTYDIYVDDGNTIGAKRGVPVCAGTVSETHTVQSSLIPNNSTTGLPIKYEITYDGVSSPSYKVLQSPLSMYINKGNSLRFHPYILSTMQAGEELELGRVYVYNSQATAGVSPIVYQAKTFATNRADIIQVESEIGIDEGRKYILITSEAGISEMVSSSLYIDSISNKRNISVYSD